MNSKFYLDKTFRSIDDAVKAKLLKKQNKKIPKSLYRDQETAIYIGVTFNKRYLKVNTRFKIKPFYFDVSKQSFKSSSSKYELVEISLNKIKERFVTSFHNARLSDEKLSVSDVKEMLKKAVDSSTSSDKNLGFFNVYDEFLKYKSRSIKKNTMHRYKHLKILLKNYSSKNQVNLRIDEINSRFAEDFKFYLEREKGYAKNTIVKYLKQIKGFSRFCLVNEYSRNQKFSLIKTTEDPSSIFVLSETEIEKIREMELEDPSLKEIRDAFCFLCFTGQRYSDLKNLKWKDLHQDGDYTFWRLYQYKTGTTQHIDIPLLPEALELLRQSDKESSGNNIFNVISNQKMNKKLKKIAKLAGIKGEHTMVRKQAGKRVEITVQRWQKVSTHAGRKSFITNAIKRGMPITMVQKISGHASLKSMKPYIYLSGNDVASELFKCFTK